MVAPFRKVFALLFHGIAHAIRNVRWTHAGTIEAIQLLVDVYKVAIGKLKAASRLKVILSTVSIICIAL